MTNLSSRLQTRRFWQRALRLAAAGLFVFTGTLHFTRPGVYERIVPPGFPNPALLVVISGACEIAGGLGLLIRPLRRLAGWGLIALLIAVFPSNVYMAVVPQDVDGLRIPIWLLWLRLPIQAVIILWVWFVALDETDPDPPDAKPGKPS
jgi:uncharacterized membrane protein